MERGKIQMGQMRQNEANGANEDGEEGEESEPRASRFVEAKLKTCMCWMSRRRGCTLRMWIG